eukprot:3071894-Lingulodinium_polyedra.AAC.1
MTWRYAVTRPLYTLARIFDPATTKAETTPGDDKLRPGGVVSKSFLRGRRVAVDVLSLIHI